jgi:peptidoglycan/xylan/chitin deacetylase (PgdA/CDA1 family)
VALAVSLLSGALPAHACSSLDDLDWMLSDWASRSSQSLTTESWRRVSEQSAEGLGFVFSLPDFKLTSSESLRLSSMSGGVYYTAKVAHNEYPVSFKLTSCSTESAVFENPDHDFPTRIAYRLNGPGEVSVDVSGTDGGGFSIDYTRRPAGLEKRIALTFDDAPRSGSNRLNGEERTRLLIRNLATADSPPVLFFSTARGINEQGDARMRAYQEAGHYIGNHSFSHQRIHRLGVEAYVADIRQAHELLSAYENFVPMFRFPFLDEGRDEETRDQLRQALRDLGYRNGYVTVDNYDFHMDSLLQQALQQGHEVNEAELGRSYVEVLMQAVRFYADMGEQYLDHSPAHTLLLHENDLAALFVDDLIMALRGEGWSIIDAMEAYADPMAAIEPDTLFNNQGRVAAIAVTKGAKRRDLVHPLEDTASLEILMEKQGVFGAPYPGLQVPGEQVKEGTAGPGGTRQPPRAPEL